MKVCLSLPGRVLRVDGPRALVETGGAQRWCNGMMYAELKAGDRVLLHAGLVVEVVTEEHAREIEAGFDELNAASITEVEQ